MRAPDVAGLLALSGADSEWARVLAAPTGDHPGFHRLSEPTNQPFLALTADRLELRWPAAAMHPLFVDFNDRTIIKRVRAGRRTPLARALGLRRAPNQTILDATCGLGRDSAVLLGLGCRIHACERSHTLLVLLRDALWRARRASPAGDWLSNWNGLYTGDATARIAAGEFPDATTIYLDPMFQAPRRRALPAREMQYLQALIGPDPDAEKLLTTAQASAAERVVLKRHPRQPPLQPPDYTVDSRQVCFDVYLG